MIKKDYDEDVQQAYKDLPVPSRLCATKLIVEMVTQSSARHLSSFDDLDNWDPATAAAITGESLAGVQTDVSVGHGDGRSGRSSSAHTPD